MGLGMSAAGALGHIATPAGAIPILAIMWTDADLSVGYTAARAIRRYGTDAVPHLISVVAGDAAPEVRAGTAKSPGELGAMAGAAIAALTQAKSDPDTMVSESAATALSVIESAPPSIRDAASGPDREILHYSQDH